MMRDCSRIETSVQVGKTGHAGQLHIDILSGKKLSGLVAQPRWASLTRCVGPDSAANAVGSLPAKLYWAFSSLVAILNAIALASRVSPLAEYSAKVSVALANTFRDLSFR